MRSSSSSSYSRRNWRNEDGAAHDACPNATGVPGLQRTTPLRFVLRSARDTRMTQSLPPPFPSLVPETAPFSPEQRAWLNGFFAGLVALDGAGVTALSP